MRLEKTDVMIIVTIIALFVIALCGLLSFNSDSSYEFINQYGDVVKMWGNGIYRNDSYFKAPIFIGTDVVVLVLLIPMMIIGLIKKLKGGIKAKLFLSSLVATSLYYSLSIALGVTYNELHLLYILVLGSTLFTLIFLVIELSKEGISIIHEGMLLTKGLTIFLIVSGISLFVAWLPDIILSLVNNSSLALIEVYTTEITYVLDMGIISPLIFLCLYQLKRHIKFGPILLAIILKICEIVGVMVIFQTLFQALAGIAMPIPVLITKVGIFIVLALFAVYYEFRLYIEIEETS